MKTAENIQASASSGSSARPAFFSKPGSTAAAHLVVKAKPRPFFNAANVVQRQADNESQNTVNDVLTVEGPKVFTKPKSFWVMENDNGKNRSRAIYSSETVTMEQLTHAIYKNPLPMLNTFSNQNGRTADEEIPAYTRIRIPNVNTEATAWAINGFSSSLIFRGAARNPFPIIGAMGVSSAAEFAHKKKLIEQELEIEKPLMSMNVRIGMEDNFIKMLKKYADRNFTEYPDKYSGGGQYVDKIFLYLRSDFKKIGSFDQITSSYDLIFNHFKRANEVRQIREFHSAMFAGDDGIREVSYSAVFLEEAFEKALTVAGVPKVEIMGFLNKAGDAIADIISKPKKFLGNLIGAVKLGFNQFVDALPTYLGPGLLDWVMEKVGVGSIDIPKDFSVKSILKLALQSLKLTPEHLKEMVTEIVGPENVTKVEKVWGILSTFMKHGIAGLADQLIAYVGDLKTTLVDKLKNWILKDLVKSAISELLQMFIPGGGLVKVVKKIYGIIQFVRSKLSDLKELFTTVGQSVLQIVKGDISSAAIRINQALKKGLYLLIDLLARLMKVNFLDGIKNATQNLRTKIVGGIKKFVEKIVVGGRSAVTSIKGKVASWWNLRKKFITKNGTKHTVYVKRVGDSPRLIIESTPMNISAFLVQKKDEIKANIVMEASEKNRLNGKIKHTQNILKGVQILMNKPDEDDNPRIPTMIAEIIANIKEIDINGPGDNSIVPTAEFSPGFHAGVRATSFAARYIFKGTAATGPNHESGTKPGDNALPDAWQVLKDMGLNYRWVRFHILNENLGGKGVDSNLIPTPTYINNEYKDEVETDLKGFYNSGLPIWLRANVTYNTSRFAGYFPSHFSATAGAMKLVDEKWVEDTTKQNSFSKQIDTPTPQKFNINKIMNDPREDMLIRNLTSVTQGILDILRTRMPEGGYRNYSQMEKAIEMNVLGVQHHQINSLDEQEILNLPKLTDEQVKKVNRLKGWMSTALFSFE